MTINIDNAIQAVTAAEFNVFRKLAPAPKMFTALSFIALTVSFGRYDWAGAAVFAALPFLAARAGNVQLAPMFRRAAAALPFICCAGIANCFFDRARIAVIGEFALSGGIISLFVLLAKTAGTVGAALLLAATTPVNEIAAVLTRCRVPCVIVLQLQFFFRYLLITAQETRSAIYAYRLRRPGRRLIPVGDWSKIAGRLFLRSVERAEAVHRAMRCRLFHAGNPLPAAGSAPASEWRTAWILTALLAGVRYML